MLGRHIRLSRFLRVDEEMHVDTRRRAAPTDHGTQRVIISRRSVTLPMYPIYSPTTGIYSTLLCLPMNSADVRSYWAVSWR
jgi:hypothetical protein